MLFRISYISQTVRKGGVVQRHPLYAEEARPTTLKSDDDQGGKAGSAEIEA